MWMSPKNLKKVLHNYANVCIIKRVQKFIVNGVVNMVNQKVKKFAAVIVVMIIIVASFGCSKKTEEFSKIEKIKESGKVVVGTCADYPPYEFHKDINGKDEIVGFDIDIAKEIAKDLGVELEIKDMKFDGLLAALDSGNVDFVIAGMTPDEERKQQVDFSKIYYNAVQAVITRTEDVNNYNDAVSLKGKKVGVQKGSIQEKIANKEIPEAQTKALGKVSDLVLELKNKKVDAIIVEFPVAKAYVANNQDLSLSNIEFTDSEGGSAVAIKKGNEGFVSKINETLDKLIKDNAIEGFFAKWSDELDK